MILGADGAKLSKHHGAVSVSQYRDEGYLPSGRAPYASDARIAFGIVDAIDSQGVLLPESLRRRRRAGLTAFGAYSPRADNLRCAGRSSGNDSATAPAGSCGATVAICVRCARGQRRLRQDGPWCCVIEL